MEHGQHESAAQDQFVGEALSPVGGTLDADAMSRGEPGLPRAFVWRDREYPVVEVLERWKTTSDCKSGSDEQYVRKHWFRIRTADGTQMRVYFERQPRSGRQRKARWWLYAVSRSDGT